MSEDRETVVIGKGDVGKLNVDDLMSDSEKPQTEEEKKLAMTSAKVSLSVEEAVEVTVVIGEDKIREMLILLDKARKIGDHSVMIEYGAVNFQVYMLDSEKLREFNANHPV